VEGGLGPALEALAAACSPHCRLELLTLAGPDHRTLVALGSEHAIHLQPLAQALPALPELRALCVGIPWARDEGLELLLRAMSRPIVELELKATPLTEADLVTLAEALEARPQGLPRLRTLVLDVDVGAGRGQTCGGWGPDNDHDVDPGLARLLVCAPCAALRRLELACEGLDGWGGCVLMAVAEYLREGRGMELDTLRMAAGARHYGGLDFYAMPLVEALAAGAAPALRVLGLEDLKITVSGAAGAGHHITCCHFTVALTAPPFRARATTCAPWRARAVSGRWRRWRSWS
jgi:hypothetical protein